MKIGHYDVLGQVGKGGVGTVYKAKHPLTGTLVAIKVLTLDLLADAVLLKRFEQEFWSASRLRHRHIIRSFDFGLDRAGPYLVMEFVPGQNLFQYVAQHGPLPEAEAIRLIRQAADALEFAHGHRLVHRDIKPENLLVTDRGHVKLTDLGLVKDLDGGSNLTRSRTALGSALFMAPEQFEDAKHADVRCDVYGLAATLYYALTATPPFQGRGSLSVLRKKLMNDYTPPRQLVPNLSEAVDRTICAALDALPKRRPATCREFIDQLLGAGAAVPVEPGQARTDGASSPRPARPARAERRIAARHSFSEVASCRTFHDHDVRWPAEIQDLSVSGVRLAVGRAFEPGTVLAVRTRGGTRGTRRIWHVRVCWARQVSPQQWHIGGVFSRELTEDELRSLLQSEAAGAEVRQPH